MVQPLKISLMALGLMIAATVSHAAGSTFLSALEDVPLMPEFNEAVEETVYFDTPSGRIVEAYALGSSSKDDIQKFYQDSLPALGWIQKNESVFLREGELLEIEIRKVDQGLMIRFALSPDKE